VFLFAGAKVEFLVEFGAGQGKARATASKSAFPKNTASLAHKKLAILEKRW
jgi:hypothetical protein